MSQLENELLFQIRAFHLPEPEREAKLAPGREFRTDFYDPPYKLALEVEGGSWSHGAHTRGARFESDCLKYDRIALEGITLLRFTADMVHSGLALAFIEDAIQRLTKAGK